MNPEDMVWISGSGIKSRIGDMNSHYIINVIKVIDTNRHPTVRPGSEIYLALKQVLSNRGLNEKEKSNMTRDGKNWLETVEGPEYDTDGLTYSRSTGNF